MRFSSSDVLFLSTIIFGLVSDVSAQPLQGALVARSAEGLSTTFCEPEQWLTKVAVALPYAGLGLNKRSAYAEATPAKGDNAARGQRRKNKKATVAPQETPESNKVKKRSADAEATPAKGDNAARGQRRKNKKAAVAPQETSESNKVKKRSADAEASPNERKKEKERKHNKERKHRKKEREMKEKEAQQGGAEKKKRSVGPVWE
jgi:hypothetical protein